MGPLVHRALFPWQILDIHCYLLFSPVSGLVSSGSWWDCLDEPCIWFIACRVRGCQCTLWPASGSTFRKRKDMLWDMLGFLHRRILVPLIQGLKEKVNSLISLFKGSLSFLPSRYGSTLSMWCGQTQRVDLNLLLTAQGGVDNAILCTLLMIFKIIYPFVSRLAILDCYLGGG